MNDREILLGLKTAILTLLAGTMGLGIYVGQYGMVIVVTIIALTLLYLLKL